MGIELQNECLMTPQHEKQLPWLFDVKNDSVYKSLKFNNEVKQQKLRNVNSYQIIKHFYIKFNIEVKHKKTA